MHCLCLLTVKCRHPRLQEELRVQPKAVHFVFAKVWLTSMEMDFCAMLKSKFLMPFFGSSAKHSIFWLQVIYSKKEK